MNFPLAKIILTTTKEPKMFYSPGRNRENAFLAITEGFRNMTEDDFRCISSVNSIPIENALSFRWAHCVSNALPNATLRFQEPSQDVGYVDFYLNGNSDYAIAFKTRRYSTDINDHFSRYKSGKYHWKKFFIVNFDMIGDTPALPDDETLHDKIFTYVHSTNTLFLVKEVFIMPAVAELPCRMASCGVNK
jgi:hypothetical protein